MLTLSISGLIAVLVVAVAVTCLVTIFSTFGFYKRKIKNLLTEHSKNSNDYILLEHSHEELSQKYQNLFSSDLNQKVVDALAQNKILESDNKSLSGQIHKYSLDKVSAEAAFENLQKKYDILEQRFDVLSKVDSAESKVVLEKSDNQFELKNKSIDVFMSILVVEGSRLSPPLIFNLQSQRMTVNFGNGERVLPLELFVNARGFLDVKFLPSLLKIFDDCYARVLKDANSYTKSLSRDLWQNVRFVWGLSDFVGLQIDLNKIEQLRKEPVSSEFAVANYLTQQILTALCPVGAVLKNCLISSRSRVLNEGLSVDIKMAASDFVIEQLTKVVGKDIISRWIYCLNEDGVMKQLNGCLQNLPIEVNRFAGIEFNLSGDVIQLTTLVQAYTSGQRAESFSAMLSAYDNLPSAHKALLYKTLMDIAAKSAPLITAQTNALPDAGNAKTEILSYPEAVKLEGDMKKATNS